MRHTCPRHEESYRELIIKGKPLTPVFSNCSGKHAGMIATATHMGEDVSTYHLPEHPVQQRILEAVEDMTGYPKEQIYLGTDGCGVPVHRLPLANYAWSFAKLARPEVIADERRRAAFLRIADAMATHPEMVGGENRYCTDLMGAFRGRIVGKAGAESVYCLGDRETGLGIAVKIEDGSMAFLLRYKKGKLSVWLAKAAAANRSSTATCR